MSYYVKKPARRMVPEHNCPCGAPRKSRNAMYCEPCGIHVRNVVGPSRKKAEADMPIKEVIAYLDKCDRDTWNLEGLDAK